MTTTAIALTAALLGALGAISAQLISAIFTSRLESRRLQWEQQRWETDAAREAAARFLMTKRALYADILRAAEDHRRTIARLEPPDPPASEVWHYSVELARQFENDPAKQALLRYEAETSLLGSGEVKTELSHLIECFETPGWEADISDLARAMRLDLDVHD